MSDRSDYRFEHVWQVPRPLDEAFAVLRDVDAYAQWWPQIRRCEHLGATQRRCAIRSVLPVTLDVVLTEEVVDPEAHLLRVSLAGDLEGFAQWQLTWAGSTTTAATWTQQVTLRQDRKSVV